MELGVLQQLHHRRPIPGVSNVVLFCHPSLSDLASVWAILQLFVTASGLRVNNNKSSATLRHCKPDNATRIISILDCQVAELPLTYLSIPLTIKRPTSAQLQPMIQSYWHIAYLEVKIDEQSWPPGADQISAQRRPTPPADGPCTHKESHSTDGEK
jgi:hypothetical protein